MRINAYITLPYDIRSNIIKTITENNTKSINTIFNELSIVSYTKKSRLIYINHE